MNEIEHPARTNWLGGFAVVGALSLIFRKKDESVGASINRGGKIFLWGLFVIFLLGMVALGVNSITNSKEDARARAQFNCERAHDVSEYMAPIPYDPNWVNACPPN